jgi:hypothetical protein
MLRSFGGQEHYYMNVLVWVVCNVDGPHAPWSSTKPGSKFWATSPEIVVSESYTQGSIKQGKVQNQNQRGPLQNQEPDNTDWFPHKSYKHKSYRWVTWIVPYLFGWCFVWGQFGTCKVKSRLFVSVIRRKKRLVQKCKQ